MSLARIYFLYALLLPGVAVADDHTFVGTPDNLNKVQIIDDEDTSWHLLTVSHSGTVSLIKGLSKGECEKSKSKVYRKIPDGVFDYEDSDIDRAECFQ